MEAPNQREFTRVPIQVQAIVKGGGITTACSSTENLSMKGLRVACAEHLAEGTECRITLLLANGEVRIDTEGTVIHCYDDGLALQFTRILGPESFEHLQKLVLYNAPDTETVEGEFHDHLGIRRK